MYRSYEDYMQTVLGYNYGSNTYRDTEMYNTMQVNPNIQEINKLYPEIYGVVYPVIQKVCSRRNLSSITEDMISEMVEEVYGVIEPGDDIVEQGEAPLRNGDVKNPRAKETRQQSQSRRRNNRLLRDLIRILILRELLQGGRPGFFPGRPGPGGPGGFPGGGPGMPPIFRPRKPKSILKINKNSCNQSFFLQNIFQNLGKYCIIYSVINLRGNMK